MNNSEPSLAAQFIRSELPTVKGMLRAREDGENLPLNDEALAGDILRLPREDSELTTLRAIQQQSVNDLETFEIDVKAATQKITNDTHREFMEVLLSVLQRDAKLKQWRENNSSSQASPIPEYLKRQMRIHNTL